MDSFEWNKIAGAVLFALLLAVGLSIVSEMIFHTDAPETPGYVIAVAEEGEAPGEAMASEPIGVLLASADAGAGETAARKCVACHTFGEGEPNRVGPNLWGVVMSPIAAHEGYQYSDAMEAFAEEAETWDYEHLAGYLYDPTGVVPGTKMAFPGIRNDAERANVIAYLRTLSDSPAPLPEPEAAEAAPEEEAAEEEQGATAAPTEQEVAEAQEPAAAEETAAADEPADAEAPAEEPVASAAEHPIVSAGDPTAGETFARRCVACHTFEEGGGNKVGPPLFGVLNRPIASLPDFQYSDAMEAFAEGGARTWDAETLDVYLTDPRGVVPGSKMIFPGIASDQDRANLIAYMATLEP